MLVEKVESVEVVENVEETVRMGLRDSGESREIGDHQESRERKDHVVLQVRMGGRGREGGREMKR